MIEYYDNLPVGVGVRPRREVHQLLCHGTVTAGVIYRLNRATAVAANGYYATSTEAAAAGANEDAQFVLALESGTTGQAKKFLFRGYGDVTADGTGLGADVAFTSDSNGDATTVADGDRILGRATVAIAADATGTVWFDGTPSGLITDSDT